MKSQDETVFRIRIIDKQEVFCKDTKAEAVNKKKPAVMSGLL